MALLAEYPGGSHPDAARTDDYESHGVWYEVCYHEDYPVVGQSCSSTGGSAPTTVLSGGASPAAACSWVWW